MHLDNYDEMEKPRERTHTSVYHSEGRILSTIFADNMHESQSITFLGVNALHIKSFCQINNDRTNYMYSK